MDLDDHHLESLQCDVIKSALNYADKGANELSARRFLNAAGAAIDSDVADRLFLYAQDDVRVLELVVRLGLFCGSVIPDATGEHKSLFERIIAKGLGAYQASLSCSDNKDEAYNACLTSMIGQLHYAFCIRVNRPMPSRKLNDNVWDCVSEPLAKWLVSRKRYRSMIKVIEPEWTSIRGKDAGLLLMDHILPRGYQLDAKAFQTDAVLSETVSDTIFTDCQMKDRVKQLKAVLTNTTMQRITQADFINNRVSNICWSLFRYFSEHLKHPNGESFVEFHITAALTDFEIFYNRAGASAAFMSFTKSLSEIIPITFSIEAVAVGTGEKWSITSEPLSGFIERHTPKQVKITYASKVPRVKRKDIFPVARHVFSRGDMLMWRIPLAGSERPGYCYGESDL
ncbi:hypothetical protein C9975_04760 [Thalassospira xiamenensis]|nr:hypothetical protein C9975_04760 [Thalassospira xiamenensis]